MKFITIIFIFLSLSSCGQNSERDLPEKNIYQCIIDNHTTSLKILELNGKIKTIIEEYKNSNIKDTIIDFSKHELTNSDIKKEPWFLSPNISKYYKTNFNKQGFLISSIDVDFSENDTIFTEYSYNKNNLLIKVNNLQKEYHKYYPEGITWKNLSNYIYNKQGHLIKKLSGNGEIIFDYKYHPKNMQVEKKSISYETDSLETDIITYDKYGLELSEQHLDYKNEKGDLWVFKYDTKGKKTHEKLISETEEYEYKVRIPDTRVKIYRLYDKEGNCIERIKIDENGKLAIRKLAIEYFEK